MQSLKFPKSSVHWYFFMIILNQLHPIWPRSKGIPFVRSEQILISSLSTKLVKWSCLVHLSSLLCLEFWNQIYQFWLPSPLQNLAETYLQVHLFNTNIFVYQNFPLNFHDTFGSNSACLSREPNCLMWCKPLFSKKKRKCLLKLLLSDIALLLESLERIIN